MMIVTLDTIFQIGRQFTFSNGSITVNTGALLAAGALALLGEAIILQNFLMILPLNKNFLSDGDIF